MRMPRRWSGSWGKLALLLCATVLLRVPTLFEPPWYDDEGIYAAIAHALLEGGTLYRDILDNRPPGIYWLYAGLLAVSGYSIAFVKLAATASLLGTQVFLFLIARRLWVSTAKALLAAGLLGVFGSLFLLEGNIANAELFMMLPVAAGVYLALRDRILAAGLCFGLAFLIKQIAGVELAACLVVLLALHPRPWRSAGVLLAGFAVPVGSVAVYLALHGTLSEFLYAGGSYYVGYVQRDARLSVQWLGVRTLLLSWVIAWVLLRSRGARVGGDWGRAPGQPLAFPLATLWAGFALYGALFTARPYPHYLLQAVPAGVLLVAGVAGTRNWVPALPRLRWVPVLSATVVSLTIMVSIFSPWPYRLIPARSFTYYENFVLYVTGQRSESAYHDFFDRRVNRNLAVAKYLGAHARPDDYLVVWGEEPWLYPLSRLRPGTPYSVSYYAYEMPWGLQRVVQSLRENRPAYVVWTVNKPLYPELKAELENNYTSVVQLGDAEIYMNSRALVQRRSPADSTRAN